MTRDEQTSYQMSGEHVAVLITPVWQTLGPALSRALAALDTSGGPVLDVGAGTGLGTRVVAATLPGARVLAVEPDRGLRTALLADVAGDPELSSRVTVVGTDLLSTTWPEQISGLVALNVLGHLSPAERAVTWRRLAERLAPGGRAVLDLSPPHEDEPVPSSPLPDVVVGDRRYGGTAQAEVTGPRLLEWRMDYRVAQGDVVVAEATVRYEWHLVTPHEVAAEVAGAGLHLLAPHQEGDLYLITR